MADELVFYTNPMSRGRIARWMLEEIGQPYPMGKVPAIRHGDTVVTEGAAICA